LTPLLKWLRLRTDHAPTGAGEGTKATDHGTISSRLNLVTVESSVVT
jgi:hypothetical protein